MMDLISFPDYSRVWVYGSDRKIPESLIWELNNKIYLFSQDWISHQKALRATGGLLHAYFLILIVDQQVNQPEVAASIRPSDLYKTWEQNINSIFLIETYFII